MNIIVTGSSRGIGRAIVLKFAREGFNTAFCARNIEHINALNEEVRRVNGDVNVYSEACDLSSKESTVDFARNAVKALGRFDVVVNNAGIFLPGDIGSADEGQLEAMMDLNLFSAYHFTRTLLPDMVEARSGHIFNMCSVASLKAYPSGGLYSISKFALYGFSKCLREELKNKGIKVTAVLPGATYTDSWKGTDLPESRFMKAEDIAQAVYDAYKLSNRTDVEEIVLRPQLGDI